MGKSALMSLNISLEQTTVSRNTMKTIIIKIDFSYPVTGCVLREISALIERWLKKKKIGYSCIDASIKLHEKQ